MSSLSEDDRRELARLCAEHDQLMAEARTQQNDTKVVYKEFNNALAPAAVDEEQDWSAWHDGWERWIKGHLGIAHGEIIREVTEALGELIVELRKEWRHDVDRCVAALQGENAELKGMLGETLTKFDTTTKALAGEIEQLRQGWQTERRERAIRDQTIVERSGRIAELQRENATARLVLERQQLDEALAEHRNRVDRIEIKLGMLLNFLGGELPRGFGRTDE